MIVGVRSAPTTKFEFLLPVKPGSIKPDPFRNNLAAYK
jgi:hypothetical protein